MACKVNLDTGNSQEIRVEVTVKTLNHIEVEDFQNLKLESYVTIQTSDKDTLGAKFQTQFDERLEPTIIEEIINKWHVFTGIAVGLIIIIIIILVFIFITIKCHLYWNITRKLFKKTHHLNRT